MRWAWLLVLAGCVDVSTAPEWDQCAGSEDTSSWTQLLPGEARYARSVATDCSGNIVVVHYTPQANAIRLSKFSPQGEELWQVDQDGGYAGYAHVAAAPNGDVLLFVPGDPPRLSRFDGDGEQLWTEEFDGTILNSSALHVGKNGTIIVAAGFVGTLGIGSTQLFGNGACSDVLLAAFNESGTSLWARDYDTECGSVSSVAVDDDGNAVVAGHVSHLDNDVDLFISKHDGRDGSLLWRRIIGGMPLDLNDSEFRSLRGISVDGHGGVLAVATTNHSLNMGDGLVAVDDYTSFVARYAANNGALRWTNQLEGKLVGWDVAVGANNAAYVVSVELGLWESGALSQYSSAGELEHQQQLPYQVRGVAMDHRGNLVGVGPHYDGSFRRAALIRLKTDTHEVVR